MMAAGETAQTWVQARRLSLAWVREHGLPLLLFTVLSIALSWPTVAAFSTHLASSGGDARHNLWIFWHTLEAVQGRQPLFSSELLFYPQGVSLLTHGLGPITGLFSLPFWPWGAEAAHNGALLVSLVLTGYFMYLLGRGLGMKRPVALFAGLMLLTAPMHLAGIFGHMTKAFLGMLPLVLLALHHTLNPRRSAWWAVGMALALLGTLLHSGYQFIFAVLAVAFFIVATFVSRAREEWPVLLRRLLFLGLASAVLVGPLFLATVRASQSSEVTVEAHSLEAFKNQADVVEFFLPATHSLLLGRPVREFLAEYGVRHTIETTVSLSLTGLALCVLAFRSGAKQARWWLLFLAICVVFSLGPSVKILEDRIFTNYDLPIILPYAFLTELPGLTFMRAPARFMMVGFVAFGIAAAFGLQWATRRWPQRATLLVVLASLLLLLETWPQPWPLEELRPVPEFYQELAADPEEYGVLDLPLIPTEGAWYPGYASYYQMYQMTHGKGIAAGYLSRVYEVHPVFPCLFPDLKAPHPDVFVNGEPALCYANTLYDLAYYNYRYVVQHKAQEGYDLFTPGSFGETQAEDFVDRFFAGQEPLVDDELVTVYAVPEPETLNLGPVLDLRENWYSHEGEWRWANSPAGLFLSIPQPTQAVLELVPHSIYEPDGRRQVGDEGVLQVALNGERLPDVPIRSGEVAVIPLDLPAGVHTLTLSLEAGRFRPGDFGGTDWRWLSFAIRSLNLVTIP